MNPHQGVSPTRSTEPGTAIALDPETRACLTRIVAAEASRGEELSVEGAAAALLLVGPPCP
jgi:hypothetical protein